MQQQSYTPSSNGIQSFADASPEYELSPIGLASMHEQAQKLAEYGRNGDIYVVHAAEGETVVPMEVLNENPKIKELLFKQMEEMGLDPQEFVVGNELNSINPDTGLPEFFFKSVFRAVKKAVKSVAKVVKKLAPIILPIAAAAFGVPFLNPAFFGPGSFGASFLGSGIGSLIGGASIKDSLKVALIAGGTASLTSGLKSEFLTPGGSFSKGVGQSFSNPGAPSFSTQVSRFGDIFTGDDTLKSAGDFLSAGPDPTSAATSATLPSIKAGGGTPVYDIGFGAGPQSTALNQNVIPMNTPAGKHLAENFGQSPTGTPGSVDYFDVPSPTGTPGYGGAALDYGQGDIYNASSFQDINLPPAPEVSTLEKYLGSTGKSIDEGMTTAGDYLFRGGDSAKVIASNVASKEAEYLTKMAASGIQPTEVGLKAAAASAQPSMLAKYGPTGLLVAGGAYLGGSFDPPPVDNPDRDDLEGYVRSETGYDLFQKDPQKYLVQNINPSRYDPGNPVVATRYSADGGYMEKPQYMNMGGTPQFPRREMLVEGPGTERSDDIPAMLSDGEFVMNAKAVRGADPSGNGNRQAGASNLYNMMRNFEMRS